MAFGPAKSVVWTGDMWTLSSLWVEGVPAAFGSLKVNLADDVESSQPTRPVGRAGTVRYTIVR